MPPFVLHTFVDENSWIAAAVQEITSELPENFTIALSGGTTPAAVYESLAQQKLSWSKAHVFQTDERFVRPENPESNQALLREHFWSFLPEEKPQLHCFETSGKLSWTEAAEVYDCELQRLQKLFDICLLGIGPDGHIASLFPNGPELDVEIKLAMISETNRFSVWKRLTLTFPAILQSKKLVVLLKGREKKAVLEELAHGSKTWHEFPAKKLLDHPHLHLFFLNE